MDDDGRSSTGRAGDGLGIAHDLWDLSLDLLVELLAAREGANQSREELRREFVNAADPMGLWRRYVSGGLDPTEIRNLLFDVARLHVQSLGDLTRIAARYTDQLASKLRARRPTEGATAAPQHLVHLQRSSGGFEGEFEVENATGTRDSIIFPRVVTFRRADGGEAFVVESRFTPASLAVTAGQAERVRVRVEAHEWFEPRGHYESTVAVRMSRGSSLQLTLQLTA